MNVENFFTILQSIIKVWYCLFSSNGVTTLSIILDFEHNQTQDNDINANSLSDKLNLSVID